jgi:RNA recognition motif-containing protein
MSETKRRLIFVGGLDNNCTEEILYAAFIPFGDIKEINIPRDFIASISTL